LKPQFSLKILQLLTIFVPKFILRLFSFQNLFCGCFRSCYFAAVGMPVILRQLECKIYFAAVGVQNLFCGWLFSFQIYFAMNVVTQ